MVATLLHAKMHHINIVNGVATREKRRVTVLQSGQSSPRLGVASTAHFDQHINYKETTLH